MMAALFFKIVDFIVTGLLWIYFIFGFIVIFAPQLLWISIKKEAEEIKNQEIYHRFFELFFKLLQFLSPRLSIEIDPKLASLRSSVIVANHLSYLDPLLIISLFEKQKTIVKNSFFQVPLFGWLVKKGGHIPAAATGDQMAIVIKQVGKMCDYLNEGGNLFVFPEGTRTRDGKLNPFNKGAFNIAQRCQAPINVIYIQNTHLLFKPGKGLFNTCQKNTIKLELFETITSECPEYKLSAQELADHVRKKIAERMDSK